jgi:hypothetical protein
MESSTNAGSTWTNLFNGGNLSYSTGITATTIFRAVTQNGSCTTNSGTSTLFIIPNIKPTPISASPSIICEGDTSN